MSATNPKAQLACRWIDQRLREVVMHYQPLVDAIGEAFDERHDAAATPPADRRRARGPLGASLMAMLGDDVRRATCLLRMRDGLATPGGQLAAVPADVLRQLDAMDREFDAYATKLAAELDWIDEQVEYGLEVQRCIRDGDVLPTPADWGFAEERPNGDGEGDE
jgi:hypothetical protein